MTYRTWAAAVALASAVLFAPSTQAMNAGNLAALAQLSIGAPIDPVACRGWGPRCPPGRQWACGPYGRCWCAPC